MPCAKNGTRLLREVERKIEAGLASARRGDLFDGDEVMRELKAMSKARRTATG